MDIIKNKNKILTVIMVVLCVVIAIGVMTLVNQNTLNQTTKKYTHEAGEELILHAGDFFDADEEQAAQITFDTSSVDINTVGEYEATAAFKGENFTIKVSVVDTTAPKAEFLHRYVFTNDMENTAFEGMFVSVADASEWSAKLVRFERKENLKVMDEKALKSLTDAIPLPCYEEELKAVGTTDVPTEDGIYRAVLEIADVYGNAALEEVYVIYDTTGARIDEKPDKTMEVAKEDLDKEPAVDKADYIITDNVDGVIDAENISCELELRDAEKHEWLVHVSYTDRAGNESKAEFLIIVKESSSEDRTEEEESDKNNADSSQDKDKPLDKNHTDNVDKNNADSDSDSQGNSPSNDEDKNNTTDSNIDLGNGENDSNNDTTNNTESSDDKEYDPADTNKDGVVDGDEALAYISPTKQKIIDAGIGNVVQIDSDEYALCVPNPDYLVNGEEGFWYLINYLAEKGLEGDIYGGWMTNDYYCYSAENVHEIDTSGLEWTDEGEIEFID